MAAIGFVSDRLRRKTIDRQAPVRIREANCDNGVVVRVAGPNLVQLSPPLIVTEDDVDAILSAIDRGLSAAVL